MAKPAHNTWDELERRIRQLIKDLENAFNPKPPKLAKVPVPVRVRPEDQDPRRS